MSFLKIKSEIKAHIKEMNFEAVYHNLVLLDQQNNEIDATESDEGLPIYQFIGEASQWLLENKKYKHGKKTCGLVIDYFDGFKFSELHLEFAVFYAFIFHLRAEASVNLYSHFRITKLKDQCLDNAEADFKSAIAIYKDNQYLDSNERIIKTMNAQRHLNLGQVFGMRYKYDEAIKEYNIALLMFKEMSEENNLPKDVKELYVHTHFKKGIVLEQLRDASGIEDFKSSYELSVEILADQIDQEKKLYRYRKIDEYLFRDLVEETFVFTNPKNFNDPFEYEYIKNFENPIYNNITQITSKLRMACMSSRPDNTPLWGYYAQDFKGVCLGYTVTKEYLLENQILMKMMDYKDRVKYDFNEVYWGMQPFEKSNHWTHEEEIRLVHFDHETNTDIIKLRVGEGLRLSDIYFGINISDEDVAMIKTLTNENKNITLHKFEIEKGNVFKMKSSIFND